MYTLNYISSTERHRPELASYAYLEAAREEALVVLRELLEANEAEQPGSLEIADRDGTVVKTLTASDLEEASGLAR